MSPADLPVLAVCGPTASGKTEVALEAAGALSASGVGVDIVCCDSMQVYRGMDIGTAKPGAVERGRVPHHCLDLVDASDEYSAADYQRDARAVIEEIHRTNRVPLMVGGTGLYLRAAVDDLHLTAPPDAARRGDLEALSLAELVARLQSIDPVRASRVDLHNPRRVVRAIEIALDQGPGLDRDPQWEDRRSRYRLSLAVVAPAEREQLRRRIDARIDAMLAAGWHDEVRRLWSDPRGMSRTAAAAIGYAELHRVDQGAISTSEAVALIRRRTRVYARRQFTWFRREPRAIWHSGIPAEVAGAVTSQFNEALAGCISTSSKLKGPATTS